jgi:nitrate reductase NapAB chaperone NapD
MSGEIHICSLVVYARQAELVAKKLRALPGLEIRGEDDRGKLIVVLEADSEMGLLEQIQEIQNLDEVLAANLVYHHCERAEALEEQFDADYAP